MNDAALETVLWEAPKVESKTQLAEHWHFLVGFEVDVRRGMQLVRTGLIDAATHDGGVVWVSRHGVQERRLLAKSEGYALWITQFDEQRVFDRIKGA